MKVREQMLMETPQGYQENQPLQGKAGPCLSNTDGSSNTLTQTHQVYSQWKVGRLLVDYYSV